MANKKTIKALLLFSGGLDSMLAVKILEEQNIKVDLYSFTSFFFDESEAKTSAKILAKKLNIIDLSKKHLKIVRKPEHGYGKGLNPCTDCHLIMIKEAKKIFKEKNYDLLVTGEVASQRPMSQQIQQLKVIEKKTGLENKILRPLSALILDETDFERDGLVNRKKLYGISGRSRSIQMKLAKKFKVKNYPLPAGGCILTEPIFAKNLKSIINYKKLDGTDVELLRSGRVFTNHNAKIIIGRKHEENLKINKFAKKEDILLEAKNIPGPLTIIRFYAKMDKKEKDKIIKKAAKLTKHHSTKTRNLDKVKLCYWHKGNKKNCKIIEV